MERICETMATARGGGDGYLVAAAFAFAATDGVGASRAALVFGPGCTADGGAGGVTFFRRGVGAVEAGGGPAVLLRSMRARSAAITSSCVAAAGFSTSLRAFLPLFENESSAPAASRADGERLRFRRSASLSCGPSGAGGEPSRPDEWFEGEG